jgi:hypothetical protein
LAALDVSASLYSSIPLISLEHLYIHEYELLSSRPGWEDDFENVQWLELLHPFTTVNLKALYLSPDITSLIALTLEELVGERATEVLPALQGLFLEEFGNFGPSEPVQNAMDKFVATRQFSDRPIVVSHWNRKTGPVVEGQ